MSCEHLKIDENKFLHHVAQNSSQLMWFLGAGSSRSSGLPTATDLIWDLKRRYYCTKENQDVQAHNISNHAVRRKIQNYFDGTECPEAWSPEEYSFFFELMFGDDYGAQQAYIQDQVSPAKVALTIGQRVLASLLDMGRARVVFTTNFDDVLELAYAAVTRKNLSPFHIEGSYAALDALNSENFPVYAKIHGDFRYRNIKNLSQDLRKNDAEIQKCFVAAAGRFGLIVAGYSGRDSNVMEMLHTALANPNAFPQGLWWTTPNAKTVAPAVIKFVETARDKGVNANIVETGPFDVMLSKIWRQIPDKPKALDDQIRSARLQDVSIRLPKPGTNYPILRTNALEVIDLPKRCGRLGAEGLAASDLFACVRENRPDAIVSYHDGVVFWGDSQTVTESLHTIAGTEVASYEFSDPAAEIVASTYLKSFYEQGIAEALCYEKPVVLRKKARTYYAVVDFRQSDDKSFANLKRAIGSGGSGAICGSVTALPDTYWAEAVRIRLEERAGHIWLLLEPDIWIKPLYQREHAQDFLRGRKIKRYNRQAYGILNAWIEILLGAPGKNQPVSVSYKPDSENAAAFTVSTRTGFSRRGGA